jgi:hypothetical protein
MKNAILLSVIALAMAGCAKTDSVYCKQHEGVKCSWTGKQKIIAGELHNLYLCETVGRSFERHRFWVKDK